MLKKLFLSALFLVGNLVFADDMFYQAIGPFGTLNNTDSALIISGNQAQDLLNVDISDGGKSVKKRDGYSLAYSLSVATSGVHGSHLFYGLDGVDVTAIFSDSRLEASIAGRSPSSVIFKNGSLSATYHCVDSQGWAYCVNTSRDPLIKTDGSTSSQITTVSTGTLLTVTFERLVMSGFSEAPNRIDFSEANDFTNWTPGGEPTDPVTFTIVSPGARLTHLTYAHGRVYWFKDSSFGFILDGPTLDNWEIVVVSPNVGTMDNTSVYRDGILYFRGQDGHIYAFDGGSVLQMLTRDIQTIIDNSQYRRTNSYVISTSGDFGAGSSTNTVYVDTITTSGRLNLTFPDTFISVRDGLNSNKHVWTEYVSGEGNGAATIINNQLYLLRSDGGDLGRTNLHTGFLDDFQRGTTFHFKIVSMPTDSGHLSDFFFTLRTTIATGDANPDAAGTFRFDFESTTTSKIHLAGITITGSSGGTNSEDFSQPATIKIFVSTTTYVITINDIVASSGTHTATTGAQYAYLGYMKGTAAAGGVYIDDFQIAPQTFTYTSSLLSLGSSMSSWSNWAVTDVQTGGNLYYQIGSTTTENIDAIVNWTTITDGQIPTIATGTHAAIKITGIATSLVPSLYIDDIRLSWFEGFATDKAYSIYFDDSIWFSITYGAGATTNNRIIRYDLKNQGSTIYDIAANGFYVRNNELYFGNPTAGYIHKYGGSTNDNGSAINAYWKSKDFIGDSPFTNKEIVGISIVASSINNSFSTFTYTVNGSSATSFYFPFYTSNSSYTYYNKYIPSGKIGSTFNVQFGNNASDQDFEIYGVQVGYRPRPWKATP